MNPVRGRGRGFRKLESPVSILKGLNVKVVARSNVRRPTSNGMKKTIIVLIVIAVAAIFYWQFFV